MSEHSCSNSSLFVHVCQCARLLSSPLLLLCPHIELDHSRIHRARSSSLNSFRRPRVPSRWRLRQHSGPAAPGVQLSNVKQEVHGVQLHLLILLADNFCKAFGSCLEHVTPPTSGFLSRFEGAPTLKMGGVCIRMSGNRDEALRRQDCKHLLKCNSFTPPTHTHTLKPCL